MKQLLTQRIRQAVRRPLYKTLFRHKQTFDCPICGYQGPFKDKFVSAAPRKIRRHSKCLGCGAFERQRMQYLVVNDVFADWNASEKRILHIAPELCLQTPLSQMFGVYHTSDLFAPNVDFKEDIQNMSFDDASYDSVCVSRVLTIPPVLNASIREIRRVLKPGGIAIIAEIYSLDKTDEYGEMRNSRSRKIGIDLLDVLECHFTRVERLTSDRYDSKYQLTNVMQIDGSNHDEYPEEVRVPDRGFKELVAVCHV